VERRRALRTLVLAGTPNRIGHQDRNQQQGHEDDKHNTLHFPNAGEFVKPSFALYPRRVTR
jgi:hypothetical protein